MDEFWDRYCDWFAINLNRLEAKATAGAAVDLDVHDVLRNTRAAVAVRFDRLAEEALSDWGHTGTSYVSYGDDARKLLQQVSSEMETLWSRGSEAVADFYRTELKAGVHYALSERLKNWEHEAQTTEIIKFHLAADDESRLASFVSELAEIVALEEGEAARCHEDLRLRMHIQCEPDKSIVVLVDGGFDERFRERALDTLTEFGA